MKRFLAILALVIALAVTANAARADKPVGLSCRGQVTHISVHYTLSNHTWFENDVHYCQNDEIYSWEIQYKRNGQWLDWSPEHLVRSGACAFGCHFSGRDTGSSCTNSKLTSYRVRAWWRDSRLTTPAHSAAYACGGRVIHV